MADPIKSMSLFFIDNQATWPKDAQLAGDLVLWPDDGKYPNAQPVAMASHPQFDGKIVALAGNRTLVLAFCKGASGEADVRKQLSSKTDPPEQYRLAIDALIHRVMLHRAAGDGDNKVHPFALLKWMQDTSPVEAAVIAKALLRFMAHPEGVVVGDKMIPRGDVFAHCEQMLDQLKTTVNGLDEKAPASEA